MTTRCATCGQSYDDAERSTLCPHRRFLTEVDQKRKDLAIALLDHELRWAHLPDGPPLEIESITWNGMVTLRGWSGEFAPHCFRVHA